MISIVIPVFNRVHLLPACLESVLAQTNPNWECILIDDGSTDDSLALMQSYCDQDPRFRLLQRDREPKGAPTCRNIGWQAAKHEYICFLDSDDVLLDYYLTQRIGFIEHDKTEFDFLLFPNVELKNDVFTRYRCLPNESNPLESFLSFNSTWQTASPLWKKSFLQTIEGWNEQSQSWQDGEIHIRALIHAKNYRWVEAEPDVLVRVFDKEDSI